MWSEDFRYLLDNLKQESCSVLDRTSISVGSLIDAISQELINNISIGAMDFDSIESSSLGKLSGSSEGLDNGLNVFVRGFFRYNMRDTAVLCVDCSIDSNS